MALLRFPRIATLVLLALCGFTSADSTLTLDLNNKVSGVPWEVVFVGADSSSIRLLPDPAFPAAAALVLGPNRGWAAAYARGRASFLAECWIRFHFRALPDAGAAGGFRKLLLGIAFHDQLNRDQPGNYMTFSLVSDGQNGEALLSGSVRPSADSLLQRDFRGPVAASNPHCVEAHFRFIGDDSLLGEVFLDSDTLYAGKTGYYYSKNHVLLMAHSETGNTAFPPIHLSGFLVSDRRPYPIPTPPPRCSSVVDGPRLGLFCAPPDSAGKGQAVNATRWRLYTPDFPDHPLFDYETRDQRFFFAQKVPFDLDTGTYVWNAFFRNRHGNLSAPSPSCTVRVTAQKPMPFAVASAFIAKRNGNTPLSGLVPSHDYDLRVNMRAGNGWRKTGYVLAFLSHVDYTIGHPGNKGGRFIPDSNYIFNLSFDYTKPGGRVSVFEKHPGSLQSRKLRENEAGAYIDVKGRPVDADTLSGQIRLPFRLLPEARQGGWILTVYHVSGNEEISNIYRTRLRVVAEDHSGNRLPLILILAAIGIFVLIIFARKRNQRNMQPPVIPEWEAKVFLRLNEYVRAHLSQEISQETIRQELGIGIHKIQKILKLYNFSTIPQLINRLRVDAAKEMLKSPDRNITEVAFAVGFKDSRYFTKVFKEFEGVLPTEFKKQIF